MTDLLSDVFTTGVVEMGRGSAQRHTTASAATLAVVVGVLFAPLGAACKQYDPPPDAKAFQPCCEGLGTCLPEGLLPQKTRGQLGMDACQPQLLCVPKALAEDGQYVARSCKAVGNGEGRCLPSCLPALAERGDQLQRGTCAEREVCAPCIDPRSGEETGACRLGGDPGPKERPYVFGRCCDGGGRCVPGDFVKRVAAGLDVSQLGSRDCTEPEALCMSEDWLDAENLTLSTCRSLLDYEGRCVPRCIVKVSSENVLPRDSCAANELCAPCFDPRTGEDTGACRRGADHPAQPPPMGFDACCSLSAAREPQGRCVPRSFAQTVADSSELQKLGQDSCAAPDALCVPAKWLEDPTSKLAACRAVGDFEGRCVPACIPQLANLADKLTQSSCDAGWLCAPCYDPVSGVESGACRPRGDAPKEPAATFAACCGAGAGMGAVGRCVPRAVATSFVGMQSADLGRLGPDSCSDDSALCVPSAWLEQSQPRVASCVALGRFEGRCLPSCLPDVQSRAGQLTRDRCAASELCVPCYDPFTGTASGACSLGGDRPLLPSQTFEACCRSGQAGQGGQAAHGSCVPRSVLEAPANGVARQDLERLGPDSCTDSEALCVPSAWLTQSTQPAAASCVALGSFEGRCLPACLPDVQAQASRLQADSCANGELCVPCYDPISGEESGACRIGSDRPTSNAQTFEACCGSGADARGRCLPRELLTTSISGADLAVFGRDSCTLRDALCVPDELAGTTPPAACRAPGNLEGRCLSDCLPGVAGQAQHLTRGSCAPRRLCAPCYDPQSGAATGVCSIAGDRPADPPGKFESCCGSGPGAKGTCIPLEFLDDSQQSLAADSCSGYPARCVPSTQVAMPDKAFPRCTTALGSRGVCIGACFVGSAGSTLGSAGCASDERCAPCSFVPAGVPGCE